jgi:general bacterial porin, GBP family
MLYRQLSSFARPDSRYIKTEETVHTVRIPLIVAISLWSAAACAQSSVALFGILDVGAIGRTQQATSPDQKLGGSEVVMNSGFWQPSQWGILGKEDLGGNIKAIFSLVSTVNVANGTAGTTSRFFDRNAYVGLSSDTWGTLTFGRHYTPLAELFYATDPLHGGNSATNMNVRFGYLGAPGAVITSNFGTNATYASNGLDRQDNSVKYSYSNHGITAISMYAFGGNAGNFKGNSSMGGLLGYDGGAVTLRGSAMQFKDPNGVAIDAYAVGGIYSFGTLQLRATWAQNEIESGNVVYQHLKTMVYSAGAGWFVTPFIDLTLAYYHGKRNSDSAPDQVANKLYFLTEYFLSKSTELIGLVEGERFNAFGSALDTGTPLRTGAGSSIQIGFGVEHKF